MLRKKITLLSIEEKKCFFFFKGRGSNGRHKVFIYITMIKHYFVYTVAN